MRKKSEQTKSKQRVQAHGEVFTPTAQVKAMLKLVRPEIARSESHFFDPACGTGNFLVEIYRQKLSAAQKQSFGNPAALEETLLAILGGIYGVDILPDNVAECQNRLKALYLQACKRGGIAHPQTERANAILRQTITCADALAHPLSMQVDVVVGNPPFHRLDGESASRSACPIYHEFVRMAKAMQPQYILMLIPARWYAGGRGLAQFRAEMLADRQMRVLCDIPNAAECFPKQVIKGGVCYFLWQRGSKGDCRVMTQKDGKIVSRTQRPLQQPGQDVFLRQNEMVSILKKVQKMQETSFASLISPNDPFGFDVRLEAGHQRVAHHFALTPNSGDVALYYHGWRSQGLGYWSRSALRRGEYRANWIKLLLPKAWGNANAATDLLCPVVALANSACTETYLVAGPFATETEAANAAGYLQTRFCHALISVRKLTQNAMKGVYSEVPLQDFSRSWTDADLYAKYNLTQAEIAFLQTAFCENLPQ